MKFSERLGYKPVKEQLQIDSIDIELKNSLWSIYFERFLEPMQNGPHDPTLAKFCRTLWFEFFKLPLDTLTIYIYGTNEVNEKWIFPHLRKYFYNNERQWYEIYDLLKFSIKFASNDFIELTNSVLEREISL